MEDGKEFRFSTASTLVRLTNRRARSLWELMDGLGAVSGSSIFEHTYNALLDKHFVPAIPQSDIAYWVGEVLRQRDLGERLASVDPYEFTDIRSLRAHLIEIIGEHFKAGQGDVAAPPGQEFHFLESVTVVTPTPFVAHDVEEFRDALSKVALRSIHHHLIEARLRLGRMTNDFSVWLSESQGERTLATAFEGIDYGIRTLGDVRKRMLELLDAHQSRLAGRALPDAGVAGV